MPVKHIRLVLRGVGAPVARARRRCAATSTADVCVVGGGIAGCSTALHLAERGYRVVLLEGSRIGWGASGRSGGQAIFGYACEPGQARRAGRPGRRARRMFDVSVEALDLLKDACRAPRDRLRPALGPDARRHQAAPAKPNCVALAAGTGRRSTATPHCTGSSAAGAALLDTDRYLGGLLDTRSGHLHPLNYTLGLAARGRSRRRADLRGQPGHVGSTTATAHGAHAARQRDARSTSCCAATPTSTRRSPGAARADHAGRHLHRRDRAARRSAHARADARERRRHRHQLGARLFPSLGGPPAAVRRPRQLLRPRPAQHRSAPRARGCSGCSRSSRM